MGAPSQSNQSRNIKRLARAHEWRFDPHQGLRIIGNSVCRFGRRERSSSHDAVAIETPGLAVRLFCLAARLTARLCLLLGLLLREFLGLALRLPLLLFLFFGLQPRALGAGLGALLPALLLAGIAFAAD